MGRIPDHLVSLAFRALENRWVTIGAKVGKNTNGKKKGGTPVELDGEGKITKGPAALTGKRPSELSQSHLFTGQDHKSQRKLFAEPGDPPPPPPIDETPKAPPAPAKKEPKPRAKKPLSMSLLAVIRREGGISSGDFEHTDFKEFGLLGALNKKGLSLDDMAATMVRQGHITVPMGKSSPSDHLLQLLKKKTNSLLAADTAEYDKDYEAYMQAREEAQADGYPEEQLAEAAGRGEEAGDQESANRIFEEIFGGDGSGGEEAGRDEEPGDLAGDSAEPASGLDTSFDFGPAAAPKVEEKPKAKPRKPKQKKDWEDRQEEKHQKALADIKAADAEKAAVAKKARELLGKVTDPGQKAQLQKLIDHAEGKQADAKQDEPAAPPAIEPKPAKKEDHEMTSAEYLRNGRPNFGDMVLTPYGKLGIMSGSGTMGSNRVKVKGVWHDRDDLKLIRRPDKDVNQNLSAEWKAKQKADLAKIDKDHGVILHKKSMVDSAKKRLQAGTMTQDQYDNFVGTGFYKMTDDEVTQAEKAQAEIDAIKNRPLEFEQSVHSLRVANALASGKDVPANVLAEYPDLAKKYGKDKAQPAPATTPPPPPATNLFGQPEPTKPQPATTQGLFGEQVPVEDPKVAPRETVADQAEKGLDWLYQKQDQRTDGTGEMFGGLFSPERTSGATEPEAGPVAPPAVEPSPSATAPKVTPPAPKTPYAQRRGAVNFSPVTGPTGHKLVGYNWEHDKVDMVDDRGENRTRKVSAWDRSTQADQTNRPIVHNFTVEAPDGTTKTVSLETAARMLGFDSSGDEPKAKFQSAVSAAKTLAKMQMDRADLVQRADRWKKDKADVDRQVEALPDDQIEEVPDTMGRPEYRVFRWKNQPEISVRRRMNQPEADREEGKRQARWALADSEMEKRGHKEKNFKPNTAKIDGDIKKAQEKLDNLTKQASQPKPEAGPAVPPTVEPSTPATAPKSQSFDDYRRANGVKDYTINHSMLSPSGKVSGRSANAAQARVDKQFSDYSQAEKEYQAKVDAGEIVDPKGKYQKPDQAKAKKEEADLLRNKAKQFRTIAASGMQTRKLTKQAEELERQANELDPVAKAEAGPVAAPTVEKPAHEMTKAEFVAQGPTDKAKQYMDISGMHRIKVQAALDAGQNVPAEVLADYPGIKKTEPQQGPGAKEITAKFQAETDARRAQGKQDEANARVRDVEDYQKSRQAAIDAGQDVEDGDEKQIRRMIRQNDKDKAKALRTIANNGPDAEAQAFADSMDKENNRLKAKLPKSAGPATAPEVEAPKTNAQNQDPAKASRYPRRFIIMSPSRGGRSKWDITGGTDDILDHSKNSSSYGTSYYDTKTNQYVKPGKKGPVKANAPQGYPSSPETMKGSLEGSNHTKTWGEIAQGLTDEHEGLSPSEVARSEAYFKDLHRKDIVTALSLGEKVPDAVLKDYPDLQATYRKQPTPESRTLSTIRQQLREAFRQCP